LCYLPVTVGAGLGAGVATKAIPKIGTRPLIVAGALLGAAGVFLLSRIPLHGTYASPADIEPGQFVRSPNSLQITPRSFAYDLERAVEMGHIRLDRVSIFDSESVAVENHIGRFQFTQDRSTPIYKVEPVGDLEPDPDPIALHTFRICERARVVQRV
jgi:hypothetical protein